MGIEYYIIKPRTEEKFYLGKDLWYNLEGMPQREPNFPNYQEWEDVACDIIKARCFSSDDTMEFIMLLSSEIYDFVESEEVRIANDCEDEIDWMDYKEVKDIHEICREVYGDA